MINIPIGYHKTDDNSVFIFAMYYKKLHFLHIPICISPMDEIFRDMTADGLYEYHRDMIKGWIEETMKAILNNAA